MSKVHDLKIYPGYFSDVLCGIKNFEVRYNDRNFKVGDFVRLREFLMPDIYTGSFVMREIVYILDDPRYCLGGYVVLGLREIT